MSRPIRIGITHGDFNGIGYEVILKALADEMMTELCTPVIFGSSELAHKVRKELGLDEVRFTPVKRVSEVRDGVVNVVDVCGGNLQMTPGHPSPEAGKAAVDALNAAADALEAGDIDVVVTAPINKKTVYSESFPFPGHTEFFARRFGTDEGALMILYSEDIKVGLVTTHLPLKDIPARITRENVAATIRRMNSSLVRDFALDRPRIAVLSLNPHNGDNGLLGTEEQTDIMPAIADCRAEGVLAFGPYAADGFFGNGTYRSFDGIVAMYHDQGLAPFKALAREYGVNYTAGLKYVRTSPDHGSGYDIAGKGEADPTSMRQAIYQAMDLWRNRRRHQKATRNPLRPSPQEKNSRPDKKSEEKSQQNQPVPSAGEKQNTDNQKPEEGTQN